MTVRRPLAVLAGALVAVALLGACGGSTDAGESGAQDTPTATSVPDVTASALEGELRISAAASLSGVFDELTALFAAENPGVTVLAPTYDGSSTLVMQLSEGADGDVLALADTRTMDKAKDAGLLTSDASLFATNTLEIAVAPGNPLGITSLADLTRSDVTLVLCAAEVPCGAAAGKAFTAAGITATPASEEQNVSAVLTKVAAGEADAGLVYATDVKGAAGKVTGVPFTEATQATNQYPITVLAGTRNAAAAQAFLDLVLSDRGQAILAGYGFGAA